MQPVLQQLGQQLLVPVIEIPSEDAALPLADALLAGGLPCAEITFRTAAAAVALQRIGEQRPEMLLGAGTVLTVEQVDLALEAGARFIVSPGFDATIVAYCQSRGVPVLPGVITPTELLMARAAGLELVKFFPAQAAGGAGYLKAIGAPFRSFSFIPTGGIDAALLPAYLALPQVHAVGGSWMAPASLLKDGDFDGITSRVREAVQLARRLRPAPATKASTSRAEPQVMT